MGTIPALSTLRRDPRGPTPTSLGLISCADVRRLLRMGDPLSGPGSRTPYRASFRVSALPGFDPYRGRHGPRRRSRRYRSPPRSPGPQCPTVAGRRDRSIRRPARAPAARVPPDRTLGLAWSRLLHKEGAAPSPPKRRIRTARRPRDRTTGARRTPRFVPTSHSTPAAIEVPHRPEAAGRRPRSARPGIASPRPDGRRRARRETCWRRRAPTCAAGAGAAWPRGS